MRQHRLAVPLQLFAALCAVLFMAVASPRAATQIVYNSDPKPAQGVDPVVTGQTVSDDQLEDWKAKRARYLKCGLCGEEQPFPDDIQD